MAATTTLPNIDSQFTAYKNAMDDRSQQAQSTLNAYKSTINSQSQDATTRLTTYKNEVDGLTRDLNTKKTEFQNSSSAMQTALTFYDQLQTKLSTLTGLITQATTNIATTVQTNTDANAELASIKTKNTQASSDASVTAGHLASAKKAADDALILKNTTDGHRNQAQGYEASAKTSAANAATYATQTQAELNKAIQTNEKMQRQYELAQTLLGNTARDINSANAGAVADIIVEEGKAPFTNLSTNLREGFVEGNTNNDLTADQLRLLNELTEDESRILRASVVTAHNNRNNLSQRTLLQMSELLAQKDTVASNILMDYMYKNEKGTNVQTVMDRVGQLNTDKKRKLEISTYYNKSREKYINILKVIVFACIIIVPLVIANKNNMLSNSIFMFITVTIIFFTIIFIFSSLVDIYKRDNIDFDKYDIPYNREGAILEKEGTLTRKKNPLTSLTLTCVGQDCCDGEMVYDKAKNKCIATENFGNAFENMMANDTKTPIVFPIEGFNNNCNMKNTMLQNSLACSSTDNFFTSECRNNLQIGG
jgi:uncharacterized membrane protein (DUF485 family)